MKYKTCQAGHAYVESENSPRKRSQCPKCYWAPVDEYIERHPDRFIDLGGEHHVHAGGKEWFRIRLENRRRRSRERVARLWDAYAARETFTPFFPCGHPRSRDNAYVYRRAVTKTIVQCRECNKRRLS